MTDAGPQQTQLEELADIERRIKRADDERGLRKVLVQLNSFRTEQLPGAQERVRAQYFLMRGVLYAKAGAENKAGGLGSSVGCLQYALEQFADSLEAMKKEAAKHGWSRELENLQRTCTYEAVVAVSVLQLWGEAPSIMFDTTPLSPEEQRKTSSALKRRYRLRSRF